MWAAWKLLRAGAEAPEVELSVSRARQVGTAIGSVEGAALVVARAESAMWQQLVLLPDRTRSSEVVIGALASALGAKAEPVEEPPRLDVSAGLWRAVASPATVLRATQAGGDPVEVAAAVARVLTPGSWVAVCLRRAGKHEWSAARRWWDHRLEGTLTHYSRSPGAVLAAFWASGGEQAEPKDALRALAAAIPGLDLDIRVERLADGPRAVATTAGLWAASAAAGVLGHQVADAAVLGVAGAGAGLSLASGRPAAASPRSRALRSLARAGVPPMPPRRLLPPRRPRERRTWTDQAGRQRTQEERAGDYPLARSAFLLDAAQVIGCVSPHAPGLAELAASRERRVPAVLREEIGPLVGWAEDGSPVHLDAGSLYEGVALMGVAGCGKSELLRALWAWHLAERVAPSGKPGHPGARGALVAIESKGEGLARWTAWAGLLGAPILVVEVADPDSPAIDLFDAPGGPFERAAHVVNAMVYGFEAGAIQDRSYETLVAVLGAAGCLGPEALQAAGVASRSVVEAAHVLLGGAGDEMAKRLAAAVAARADVDPDAATAVARLSPLFGPGVSPSARRQLSEAPRNKLALLTEAGSWWSPDRPRIGWEAVLESHWAVALNVGSSSSGRLLDERLGSVLAAMSAYSLRAAIMRRCNAWQAAGRSVSIFADELALLAGSSPEVVTWLRDQGRSYGVRCFFATQRPEQLAPAVRECLLGFGSVFWFRQTNPQTVEQAIAGLSLLGGDWQRADVAGLPSYHAILAATAGGRGQPPVTVKVAWWDDDAERFLADQGLPRAS